MRRNAAALWQGNLKTGTGEVSTESGALANAPYTFDTRFAQAKGTNPEELIAAAHAGCYSMALSLVLGESGITPERIDTTANVDIEPEGDGFRITAVHLDTFARIPGIEQATFEEAAQTAKDACPVSRALDRDVRITLKARLES